MSDITLWDSGPVKIYDDGKGNYNLQICSEESNAPFWGADMNAPETVKSYIAQTQLERIAHGND